jgi:hypothetical protein
MRPLGVVGILVGNPQHEARDGKCEGDNGDFEHGNLLYGDIGRANGRTSSKVPDFSTRLVPYLLM